MALTALIAITLCCIAWSVWVRRVTWSYRWEVAATLNVVLQGVAIVLMSPLASATVGHALHTVTGEWNLAAYIGHSCYIVAASAVVYNVLGRLADDDRMQALFKQYVERPATLCIPVLFATFTLGNGTAVYRPDFLDVPTDFWLSTYWLLLCSALIYLLMFESRVLLILRKDPRSRRIANLYLASSVSGIIACAVRIATACDPPLQSFEGGRLVWLFACLCGTGFALTSAHSWRIKTRWFARATR